MAVTPI